MAKRGKFAIALAWVFLPTLGVIVLVGIGIWAYHGPHQRAAIAAIVTHHTALVLLVPACLLGLQAVLLQFFFNQYLLTPLEVAERARMILEANPSHRIEPTGGPELHGLEEVINDFANRYQALQRDIDVTIRESQARLEEEKNRLVALLSEFAQSVLVCNADGRILFYNDRARQLLGRPGTVAAGIGGRASLVGLGRSVFALLDRGLITHALRTVQARLGKQDGRPGASFVATVGGQLIRVQMAPVLGSSALEGGGEGARRPPVVTGFVLIMDDVTRVAGTASRKDAMLTALLEATRRASANIRAAVETMLGYPDMDSPTKSRFMEVIREEVAGLSAKLEGVSKEHSASVENAWLLEDMLGADLVSAAAKEIESSLGLPARLDAVDAALWLKVDSHALVQCLTSLARRLRRELGALELRLVLQASGRLAQLGLLWSGGRATAGDLTTWETDPVETAAGRLSFTLRDVVERHGGDLLHEVDRASGGGAFRLLLPLAAPEQTALAAPASQGPRPEYYDFDLFHQAGQTPQIDQRRLSDLAYTVFDTETTGLDPSGGDEIISIGAVRIVNGRLLRDDAFEQLVDPRRPVSLETIKITGIDPAMLQGLPTLDEVLPHFHSFCEDTVLVAHNAAFDMRFLQLKEERTGIRFTQPVLDTLLLAAVAQPNINAQQLEALAERFGVDAIGRHTALGDAMMTGEIFLKLLPLLAERGILTLKDAREASRQKYQARLEY